MFIRKTILLMILLLAARTIEVDEMHPHQRTGRTLEEYSLGRKMGSCLVKGCIIISGTIRAIGDAQRVPGVDYERAVITRTVVLKADEWIYGKEAKDEKEFQLVHARRPVMTKTTIGPWSAWEGIDLKIGERLLVFRWSKDAKRATWLGKPENIALVVSDEDLFGRIRDVVAQHARYDEVPEELLAFSRRLLEKSDNIFAGYIVTYLMQGESVRDVDGAARFLSSLLGNKGVPESAWNNISDWLVSNFYRLSNLTRKSITEALVVTGSREDIKVAESGIVGLIRLGDAKMLEMKPVLDPVRRRKLIENYHALLSRGRAQKGHTEFESELGLELTR